METGRLSQFIAVASLLTAGLASGIRADDTDFRYARPYGGRVMNFWPRESFAVIGGQVYPVTIGNQSSKPPAPNSWLNFRHPYTHAYVTVPVALPPGMPRVERQGDRIIYDYGYTTVVIHFVRDGSVNVSYNPKMS